MTPITIREPTIPALLMPRGIFDAMVAHCLREAPAEACGILGGVAPLVSEFFPLHNVLNSPTRYLADPKQVVDAVLKLRAISGEFLAIYHSHPKFAAVPSAADLKMNYYGDLPRIIVSLLSQPADVRVWILAEESYKEIFFDIV